MKYLVSSITFLVLVFAVTHTAEAVVLLEPSIVDGNSATDPGSYFANLYQLGIGLAAILAVVMLVWGGLEYIGSAASPSAKQAAKDRIWAAIGGLLLALLSYVILQTINPALVGKKSFNPGPNPHDSTEVYVPQGSVQIGEVRFPGNNEGGGGASSDITVCTASGYCR